MFTATLAAAPRTALAQPAVHIIEDDLGIRRQIQTMVQSVGLSYHAFASGPQFFEAAETSAAGCIILDDILPGCTGHQLLEELPRRGFEMPVIMVSECADVASAVQAMKLGAVDYFVKPLSGSALIHSMLRAVELDQSRRGRLKQRHEIEQRLGRLTPRERQVLELVVRGHASKQVATELALSQKTVEAYRTAIMEKLGVSNVAELVHIVTLALCWQ